MSSTKIIMAFLFTIGFGIFPTSALTSDLPQAKEEKGLVIFYRLSNFKGKAIRFNINHSEGSLGQLLSGTFMFKYLEPGEHRFWSQAVSQDSITINVGPGKTYYAKGEVKMGLIAGRPKFTQMSESAALSDLERLQ